MERKDEYTIRVEDMGAEGQGIGRVDGRVVFIPGALPGEQVLVTVTEVKKNYAVAELKEILEPSKVRQDPPCKYFGRCGGCDLQHMAYAAQLNYKHQRVMDSIQRIGGLNTAVLFPLPSEKTLHYRNKVSFPIQKVGDEVRIGLYEEGTHHVVDLDECLLATDEMKVAVSQLRVWITKHEVSVYDPSTGKGLLRHVVLRQNEAGDLMMVLVIAGQHLPYQQQLLALYKMVLPKLNVVLANRNYSKSRRILGDENEAITPRDRIFETLHGLDFQITAGSFFQVNTRAAHLVYQNLLVEMDPQPEDTLLDLYAGAGVISLLMADKIKQAYGIELSHEAAENARHNAGLNEIENTVFFEGDALRQMDDALREAGDVQLVTVDPPRAGLEPKLIERIVGLNPRRIGYVSCDPATLARDLAAFAKAGYTSRAVHPVDMFPQTTHVECVAVLSQE